MTWLRVVAPVLLYLLDDIVGHSSLRIHTIHNELTLTASHALQIQASAEDGVR